jgi:hypothetical protein
MNKTYLYQKIFAPWECVALARQTVEEKKNQQI